MKYRKLIEENFLIDQPDTGELVEFKFNPVQSIYYEELCKDYDIENKGLTTPIRENILKARREGFSSLILAIFCADDISNANPTETCVLSYKDDATSVFRKRYRTFALSFFARRKMKVSIEDIKKKPAILDLAAKKYLSVDATDIEFAHNKAHFYCGTASAKVGGRGGVLQKLLFSEIAYYPDTEKITAKEIIEGTMRQVDPNGGWIFAESTENGKGTYQYKLWQNVKLKISRFKNRFYGAGDFYSKEQLEQIKSEFVDMDMFRREYPMTEDDLFASSSLSFVPEEAVQALVEHEDAKRKLIYWMFMQGTNYMDQCELLNNALEMIARQYPHNALYAGIDIAKQHDKTVLTIVMDKEYAVRGGIKCVALDSTGGGDFMPDWFERNSRYYLERVKFSRMSKNIMYSNLTVVIKDKQTELPLLVNHHEFTSQEAQFFWNEMTELQKKIVGDMMVVSHPSGEDSHDDFPDSWALAEYAYMVINGVDKKEKAKASTTMPNIIDTMLNKKMNSHKMVDSEYD